MAKKNKKINYNPFKMGGSWVGGVLLFVYGFFGTVCTGSCPISNLLTMSILLGIFGFLVGWAIHSLIRKIRSKK